MMRIEVNNGGYIEIGRKGWEIFVESYDHKGNLEDREGFSEGEIVMALNLLRYMKDNNLKDVYLMQDYIRNYCRNLIDNGDIEEFRILE